MQKCLGQNPQGRYASIILLPRELVPTVLRDGLEIPDTEVLTLELLSIITKSLSMLDQEDDIQLPAG